MGLCGGMPEEMTTGLKGKTIAVASSDKKPLTLWLWALSQILVHHPRQLSYQS